MSLLHVEGVTHWSIPVNNLEEAEAFYGDLLGLTPVGRLGTARMACFTAGAHHILLCERAATMDHTFVEDPKVHHSFTVSPETLVRACKVFREQQIRIEHLSHRQEGVFPGRELYFFDPSGNRLERAPNLARRHAKADLRGTRQSVTGLARAVDQGDSSRPGTARAVPRRGERPLVDHAGTGGRSHRPCFPRQSPQRCARMPGRLCVAAWRWRLVVAT